MKLEHYRDSAGDPRARGKGQGQTVAGFLESDLQDSPEAAREVLRAVDDVEAGRAPTWERTGNAYTLALSPGGGYDPGREFGGRQAAASDAGSAP